MKRFLTAAQAALVLLATAAGTSSLSAQDESPDTAAMTGAYYMRDSLVPRADDLALIMRKPALYVASFNDDMATVAYSLENGRLVYRVVEGEIDDAARAQIDRALVRLQRKLA
ncbi:hypothetical protein [Novosphingobium soli]|uniref:Uncharacterized protein n=1 Tax=Novosphingobium soli TaxID=574956 RepID=A0ABV6CZW6_9SPHN